MSDLSHTQNPPASLVAFHKMHSLRIVKSCGKAWHGMALGGVDVKTAGDVITSFREICSSSTLHMTMTNLSEKRN